MQNLQFITHYTEQYGYTDAARLALEGGCRWIQLRMKDASPEEWMRTGEEVEAWCHLHLRRPCGMGGRLACRRCPSREKRHAHRRSPQAFGARPHHRRDGQHIGRRDAACRAGSGLHRLRPVPFYHDERKARPDPRLGRGSPDLGRHEKERHFATTDCHRRNYKRRHPSVDGNGSGRHRPERHDPESRKSHRRNPEHPENIERTTIIKQQIYGR